MKFGIVIPKVMVIFGITLLSLFLLFVENVLKGYAKKILVEFFLQSWWSKETCLKALRLAYLYASSCIIMQNHKTTKSQ